MAWVQATGDNHGQAFVVVDKRAARVHLFDGQGNEQASSPVLLGLAKGDDSVAGIGDRKMADIRPDERTTPAGRFVTEPGTNLQNEDIVWIDYDAAVSMHRVRTSNSAERRLQRLASPTTEDNRISYGCINVPVTFYDRFIQPTLGKGPGLVYVMPEVRSWAAVLSGRAEVPPSLQFED
ncbi:L,D-transpeptidase [Variovorax saccharolyticus]|uniref:L,D-transpeptidase n=1 Tax=Variovorax saccharolyticus TaxID=3053516 RepID=UPI002578B4C8|nr:L,D-transpeptidase [Variovorax sp. J22R187]MDM0022848.1 L,D-transpeptidase [Variovorax sp. J22R187]